MDKVRVLCAMSGAMMQEFSTRTAARLGDYTLFKLLLPAFRAFLDINVRKEIEKDRLVIMRAGSAPQEADIQRLLQQAREIDQKFLQQAAVFPVNIHIEYRDIEEFRRRRIERLLELAGRLLAQWETTPRFRAAVAHLYSRAEFESLLREILELYSAETKMLSRSVHIPQIFNFARDSLSETVHTVMVSVAKGLAAELTRKVYRRVLSS
ncbi:MAG: hypothetical protein WB402_14650 [Sulfuricaulis sp.]|uniref:hypothetical protein n=1 Tax=Sulfuricaulis sp. TaxID=2003553 RepID=UPI003C5D4419